LPPLATSLTFVFLSRAKIVSIADPGIPYPAFVVIGTVLWQTFVDAINSPIKMVQNSRAMLAKINFPREALLLAGLAEVLFNFVVRLAIVVAVLVWHQLPVPVTALLAVLGVLALVSFGMMLGILLIPLGMLYSDVGRGLGMITGFRMMLTPVVYPVPSSGLAAVVAGWNPVAPLVTVTRHWLTVGPSSATGPFMAIVLSTVILMLLGWVLYRIAMPHIIARMPN
jgi:lipopolysaccharide transport system permease protein